MTMKWSLPAALAICTLAGVAFAAQSAVSQKGKTFSPNELSENAGTTLRVNNDDDVPHNITVNSPDGIHKNLGVQKPGESVDIALDKVGAHTIRCGIHPKMKLIVNAK